MVLSLYTMKQEANARDAAWRCTQLDDQPQSEYLGPDGCVRYTGSSGCRICGYFWPAQKARGVVIHVHGQGSYLVFEYGKFQGVGKPKSYEGSWIQALNLAGFSVAGIDNRGCGRSDGLFGYVEDHQLWIDDLLQFTKSVQNTDIQGFAGLPLYMLGSSLGGCLAAHTALHKPDVFRGLLLLAPMVSLEKLKCKGLNPILLKIAALLNWFIPTWPLVATNKNHLFPELQQDWDSNPCTYSYKTRVRIGVECLRACDRLLQGMHKLECPLLVMHSIKDDMTDPNGSKLLVEKAQSSDKTLKLIDNMWHILTKEPGSEQVLQDCIEWLTAHLPPPRSASSGSTSLADGAASAAGDSSWEQVERDEAAGADD